jgi:hypothetical protein
MEYRRCFVVNVMVQRQDNLKTMDMCKPSQPEVVDEILGIK